MIEKIAKIIWENCPDKPCCDACFHTAAKAVIDHLNAEKCDICKGTNYYWSEHYQHMLLCPKCYADREDAEKGERAVYQCPRCATSMEVDPTGKPSAMGDEIGGLQITCDKCGHQIIEQGALLFSPPEDNKCIKTHICKKCFDKLLFRFSAMGEDEIKKIITEEDVCNCLGYENLVNVLAHAIAERLK